MGSLPEHNDEGRNPESESTKSKNGAPSSLVFRVSIDKSDFRASAGDYSGADLWTLHWVVSKRSEPARRWPESSLPGNRKRSVAPMRGWIPFRRPRPSGRMDGTGECTRLW